MEPQGLTRAPEHQPVADQLLPQNDIQQQPQIGHQPQVSVKTIDTPDRPVTVQDPNNHVDSNQILNLHNQNQIVFNQLSGQLPISPPIQPLLTADPIDNLATGASQTTNNPAPVEPTNQPPVQPNQLQNSVIAKLRLTDELNIFDWLKTKEIINQIAEKAKNSVDSVITAFDPGMKEYLYSGGDINIIVTSNSAYLVGPIRDAFQIVFGRATVVASTQSVNHPVKLACGIEGALVVAQENTKKLRLDTNNVPQNQVIVAVQPCLMKFDTREDTNLRNATEQHDDSHPQWFLTYCMLIEDPVLGVKLSSYSQFVPVDQEAIAIAEASKLQQGSAEEPGDLTGFSISISELMTKKLNLTLDEDSHETGKWLKVWSGLDEDQVVLELGLTLAHSYRRKLKQCTI